MGAGVVELDWKITEPSADQNRWLNSIGFDLGTPWMFQGIPVAQKCCSSIGLSNVFVGAGRSDYLIGNGLDDGDHLSEVVLVPREQIEEKDQPSSGEQN